MSALSIATSEPPPKLPGARQAPPQPPSHLSKEIAGWWRRVVSEFELEEHHRLLLTAASQAWDRMTQAREAIAAFGLCYIDDKGTVRSRPEVAIERDSRLAFARLLRELDLDCAAPSPERPPALGSNRG